MEEVYILKGIETLVTFQLEDLIFPIEVDFVFAQDHHGAQCFEGEHPVIHGDAVTVKADGGVFDQQLLASAGVDPAEPDGFPVGRFLCQCHQICSVDIVLLPLVPVSHEPVGEVKANTLQLFGGQMADPGLFESEQE